MAPDPTDEFDLVTVRSSGGVELTGNLARSTAADRRKSITVVFFHGFPSLEVKASDIGGDLVELCVRGAEERGWNALTVRFRGCGESSGQFSLARWVDDASAAIRFAIAETAPDGLWVCGFGTGGSVGLVAAADDDRVDGVVTVASPADFDDWAADPDRLLDHAREVGVITSDSYPTNIDRWKAELQEVRAVEAAEAFSPRPLLVLHGSADEAVPHFDARLVADAHGAADLRFVPGASHQLRHDPRAVSVLLAWLDRHSLGEET